MNFVKGNIYTKDFNFVPGTLYYEEGRIKNIELSPGKAMEDNYIIPGLVDIHSHGCFGHDTCDASYDGLKAMLDFEKSQGITSYLPTTMTLSEEKLIGICQNIDRVAKEDVTIKGIYLEGPFISHEKKGAQNPLYITKPDLSMIERIDKASGGRVKIVAVAPEVDGALGFISEASKKYRLTLAHSTADYEIATNSFNMGIKQVTHLYNAMPPYSHREPGVVGAAMDKKDVMVEMIADGIHIHPSVIRGAFKAFGEERIIFISDSMEATGMPDGQYSLGGQEVFMKNKRATLADNTIAGSAATLYDCLKNAIAMGIPAEQAVRAATYNPAFAAGILEEVGSLEIDKLADFLVMDGAFNLMEVYQSGRKI